MPELGSMGYSMIRRALELSISLYNLRRDLGGVIELVQSIKIPLILEGEIDLFEKELFLMLTKHHNRAQTHRDEDASEEDSLHYPTYTQSSCK